MLISSASLVKIRLVVLVLLGSPTNLVGCEIPRRAREMGYTWNEIERLAQDRERWRAAVDGLCPQRVNRLK